MSDRKLIAGILADPLEGEWTVDLLARRVIDAVAAAGDGSYLLDGDELSDRQSLRMIRPVLASLAVLSAAESKVPPHPHGGRLFFERESPEGPVWIVGRFANQPARAWIALHRLASASATCDQDRGHPTEAAAA